MNTPPLQTHGLYDKKWIPPVTEPFVTYEPSDEPWAAWMGKGSYETSLKPLYDVREKNSGDLVGYTRLNPRDYRVSRGIQVSYCPEQRQVFWTVLSDAAAEIPTFTTLIVKVGVFAFDRERYFCWMTDYETAMKLLKANWISAIGEDNKDRLLFEIRRRQAEQQQRLGPYAGRSSNL